jgi:Fe2+ or Zn2+ uptake regulation protein
MSGVSTFDLLGDMPSAQRILMRLFLRHIEMSAADLESKVAELPEEKRLTKAQIEDALAFLIKQGWVRKVERGGKELYTVQQQSSKN